MYNKNLLKTIDYAVGLDLVMQMSNLIEYSSNYSKTNYFFGFILKMKQLILVQTLLMIIISNHSSTR